MNPQQDAPDVPPDAPAKIHNTPDLSIFKQMIFKERCGSNLSECPSLQRIKSLSRYYQLLRAPSTSSAQVRDPGALFVEFCDEVYSKQSLLADYIHFITKHSYSASRAAIVADLKCECPEVDKCARTQRHCRREGATSTRRAASSSTRSTRSTSTSSTWNTSGSVWAADPVEYASYSL